MEIETVMLVAIPPIWYVGVFILIIAIIGTVYCYFKEIDHPFISFFLLLFSAASFLILRSADGFFTAIASIDYPLESIAHALFLIFSVIFILVNCWTLRNSMKIKNE